MAGLKASLILMVFMVSVKSNQVCTALRHFGQTSSRVYIIHLLRPSMPAPSAPRPISPWLTLLLELQMQNIGCKCKMLDEHQVTKICCLAVIST